MFDINFFSRYFSPFLFIKTLGPELGPQFFCSSVRLDPSGRYPWLWNIKLRDSQFRKGKQNTETLGSVVDPGSLDPDTDPYPAFEVNPDPVPEFWLLPKLEKKTQLIFFFFWSKVAIYLFLGLHKGHPSYRRSLQPSKRTSSTSKD